MQEKLKPVDYLIIGHITKDITPQGYQLGGTASYAALTAKMLGLEVGILTSYPAHYKFDIFRDIQICNIPAENFTEFRNVYKNDQRTQYIYHIANKLSPTNIPEEWLKTPFVHIAPVACEIDPAIVNVFTKSRIGITPQGWLRKWDKSGLVSRTDLSINSTIISNMDAIILSLEDIGFDENCIEIYNELTNILVITEGKFGSRVYWNNDQRHFTAPEVEEVDPTGVGDIYASSFFVNLLKTNNPWSAAQFATKIAANSVQREGLKGIPTIQEIKNYNIEVF